MLHVKLWDLATTATSKGILGAVGWGVKKGRCVLNWSYLVPDFAVSCLGPSCLLPCCRSDSLSSVSVVLPPEWPQKSHGPRRREGELEAALQELPEVPSLLGVWMLPRSSGAESPGLQRVFLWKQEEPG